jgi:hypothetical protein
MASNKIMDTEFFDDLESQISPVVANNSMLEPRVLYGALYAYYTFNRGRAENLLFFETALEEEPTVLHCEMASELFQLAYESTIIDKERLDMLTMNFFKPNTLLNWDQEVKNKQRLITNYFRMFRRINYLDEQVWEKMLSSAVGIKRVNNMENYDTILNCMIWYNDNPKSPMFQKVGKYIELFKDKIRTNENRFWKYDPENACWRTYDELMKRREEIDETFAYCFVSEAVTKGDLKQIEEKEEITKEDVKRMVEERLNKKMTIMKIKHEMAEMNVLPEYVENILIQIAKEKQSSNVDSLKKKGIFTPEMSRGDLKELRDKERKVPKSVSSAPAGKKDAKGKK